MRACPIPGPELGGWWFKWAMNKNLPFGSLRIKALTMRSSPVPLPGNLLVDARMACKAHADQD